MVEGINVSQAGKPYRSIKGTVSPQSTVGHWASWNTWRELSLGLLHQCQNIHQGHGGAVNRDSIYAIKTLLPTVEST